MRAFLLLLLAGASACAVDRPVGATSSPPVATASAATGLPADYVGSGRCASCHRGIFDRWKRTRMANVVRDPRQHPDAIIPDLSIANPLVTFTKDDIAFVYGSKWKQRYFTRVGADYFPLPAQWDIAHGAWKPYLVADGTDWWVPFYPKDNAARPTGPLCDGCHSVGYDVKTKGVREWNVGCEKCHGPGSAHVTDPTHADLYGPRHLDAFAETDTCIQCHSQGRPLVNPIEGRTYDWPVGFRVGLALKDFWRLETPELGKTTFTHFADGSAHKNRMQGNDFVQSVMYAHGVTCSSCHDSHGTDNDALLLAPGSAVCARCHAPGSRNGPRAPTLEAHTHHRAGSPGSDCVECHMPKNAQEIGDVNVRSHTFRFVTPAMTDRMKVPNPCTNCHADRSTTWAADALRSWSASSPGRTAP